MGFLSLYQQGELDICIDSDMMLQALAYLLILPLFNLFSSEPNLKRNKKGNLGVGLCGGCNFVNIADMSPSGGGISSSILRSQPAVSHPQPQLIFTIASAVLFPSRRCCTAAD